MADKKTHRLARWILAADMAGISALLMFLDFRVPYMPAFLKFDFSDLVVVLGGLIIGPAQGVFIAAAKVLLNVLLRGSATNGVGEIAAVFCSFCFMYTTVLVYRRYQSRLGIHTALVAGTVLTSIVATAANYFFILPVYRLTMGYSTEMFIEMCARANPYIVSLEGVTIAAVLPFNLLKYIVISLSTYLFYNRLNMLVNRYIF